jgi:hypothetical protein
MWVYSLLIRKGHLLCNQGCEAPAGLQLTARSSLLVPSKKRSVKRQFHGARAAPAECFETWEFVSLPARLATPAPK